jgi:hypothetical protein
MNLFIQGKHCVEDVIAFQMQLVLNPSMMKVSSSFCLSGEIGYTLQLGTAWRTVAVVLIRMAK